MFEAKHATDLRSALVSAEVQVAFIADPGAFAADDPADKQSLLEARDRGLKVVTLEPMPGSLAELSAAGGSGAWARLCPLSRLMKPVRDAIDLLPTFGPVRSASIQCLSSSAEGSLGARLLDAMDLLLRFFDGPDVIDAAYCAPQSHGAPKALRAVPGENLRGRSLLRGDIAASVRFTGGRAASVLVSDQAARFELSGTLIGSGGRIVFTDRTLEWIGPAGEVIDKTRSRRTVRSAEGEEPLPSGAPEIAAQVRALLEGADLFPGSPADYGRALALAQTALLSARTGEGESPETMQRLTGVA